MIKKNENDKHDDNSSYGNENNVNSKTWSDSTNMIFTKIQKLVR